MMTNRNGSICSYSITRMIVMMMIVVSLLMLLLFFSFFCFFFVFPFSSLFFSIILSRRRRCRLLSCIDACIEVKDACTDCCTHNSVKWKRFKTPAFMEISFFFFRARVYKYKKTVRRVESACWFCCYCYSSLLRCAE